jgi:hypothetical protein
MFPSSTVPISPRHGPASPIVHHGGDGRERRWAVVARPHYHRIAGEAHGRERIEDAPDVVVVLEQAVAKLAAGRIAFEIRMGERRMVGKRERDVEKKRAVAFSVSRDVVDRTIGHHSIDLPARVLVVQLHVARRFPFPGFTDVVHVLERHAGVAGPVDDVGRLEAEPLIEALVRRQASVCRPEVPLPDIAVR